VAGNNIGTVSIEVEADATGFREDLEEQLSRNTSKTGATVGGRISAALGGALKIGAAVAGTAVAAALGTALIKGFGRLQAIDEATAKLKGLGNSAEDVKGIMENALNAVKGTAFGLGEAASQAAVLVAAGIKPGKELEQTLKTLASTAAVAGTGLQDVGDIFADVAAKGKLTTDALNRLAERGVPALSFLAKHFGITQQAAAEMVTKGKVSFAEFEEAMSAELGPAALAMGDSFSGMVANVGAAASRLGAKILGPVFEGLKDVMPGLITSIDDMTEAFAPLAERIGPAVAATIGDIGAAVAAIDWIGVAAGISAVLDGIQATFGWIVDNGKLVISLLAGIAAGLLVAFGPAIIVQIFLMVSAIVAATTAAWAFTVALLANPLTWIVLAVVALVAAIVLLALNWDKVVKWITEVWAGFIGWITPVIDAFVAYWTGIWAQVSAVFSAIWEGIVAFVTPIFNFIATIIRTYIEIWVNIFLIFAAVLVTIWKGIVAVVTWAWEHIVAFLSPIINFIVDLIVGTFTMVVEFWTGVWNDVVNVVTTVWNSIVNFLQPIVTGIVTFITSRVQAIFAFWSKIWNAIAGFVVPIWNQIVSAVSGAIGALLSIIGGILGKIIGFFTGVGTFLFKVGKDLIQGLINGIADMAKWVIDAIGKVVNGAIDWAKGVLGIKSPSTVFADIGHQTMAGYVNGIEAMAGAVQDAYTTALTPPDSPVLTPGGVNGAGGVIGGTGAGVGASAGAAATSPNGMTVEAGAFQLSGPDPWAVSLAVVDRLAERAVI
jgi:tape measure domain-containing protein